MDIKSTNSLQNICRTCMTRLTKHQREDVQIKYKKLTDVPTGRKDKTIMELLEVILPHIKVDSNDYMPKLICSDCISKLILAHEFIEIYKRVDNQLRSIIEQIEYSDGGNNVYKDPWKIFEVEDEISEHIDMLKEIDIYGSTKNEFNNEAFYELSDKDEYKETFITNIYSDEEAEEEGVADFFTNPYSDDSNDEWKPNEESRKKKIKRNIISRKQRTKKGKEFIEKSQLPGKANAHQECEIASLTESLGENTVKLKEVSKEQLVPIEDEVGIPCQECETVFPDESILEEHMRFHRLWKIKENKKQKKSRKNQIEPQQKFKCVQCDKEFTKRSSYIFHKREHAGEGSHLCIECGKRFSKKFGLKIHMLRHKGEKPVQCPQCPKKFVCSSGLYNHMMVHTKEKAFVCDICGRSFHMATHLRKHKLYHNGIKEYPCQYCNMRFVTAERQRRHARIHTGEKPYACKYCEKAYAQSNDLIKHLKQHLGDNVYQCELCPLRFPMARDLRIHFATHKDDSDESRARYLEDREEEEKNLKIKF